MNPSVINVISADVVGDCRLHIVFDDGFGQTVDFRPFLLASSHPDIRAWLDPQRFGQFRIEFGELVWGDYELCFPLIDLYRNRIQHRTELEAAA